MFCDQTTLRLGDVTLKVRRLTVAEIRAARVRWQGGKELIDDEYDAIVLCCGASQPRDIKADGRDARNDPDEDADAEPVTGSDAGADGEGRDEEREARGRRPAGEG